MLVITGSGVRMTDWNDRVAAILYCWYPGQNGMRAVADILTGDVNPSGKLPMTIAREYSETSSGILPECAGELYNSLGQLTYKAPQPYDIPYRESVFTGHRWYESKGLSPLYPFGHGLSYTTFEISEPIVEIADGRIRVSANVKNTGIRSGAEAVQLYVGEMHPTVSRPTKELKGISKVNLAPGETKVTVFELTTDDLAFWSDITHRWEFNPGDYTFYIGTSSADIAQEVPVTIPD